MASASSGMPPPVVAVTFRAGTLARASGLSDSAPLRCCSVRSAPSRSRLVDHQDVGDLEQSRFHGLDVVAETGRGDDDAHIRHFGHVDVGLAGADRLEQDDVLAGGIERVDHAHRGRAQAAQMSAAGERAHEHAVVVERRRHADAVAQDGAAGDRAGRIDGDDADGLALRAQVLGIGVDERRLARPPGGPVKPTTSACPRCGCIASSRRGAAADRRSSSVTAREVARRSPARMRTMSALRSARSWASGLGLVCAMQVQILGHTLAAQLRRSARPQLRLNLRQATTRWRNRQGRPSWGNGLCRWLQWAGLRFAAGAGVGSGSH